MFQSDGIRNIFFNRLKQQQRKEKNEVTKFYILSYMFSYLFFPPE